MLGLRQRVKLHIVRLYRESPRAGRALEQRIPNVLLVQLLRREKTLLPGLETILLADRIDQQARYGGNWCCRVPTMCYIHSHEVGDQEAKGAG